jgi:hypothetical protein
VQPIKRVLLLSLSLLLISVMFLERAQIIALQGSLHARLPKCYLNHFFQEHPVYL